MVGDVERVEAGVFGLPGEIEPRAWIGVETGLQAEADRRERARSATVPGDYFQRRRAPAISWAYPASDAVEHSSW